MKLSVLGLNHRSAPVEVREKVSLAGSLGHRLLRIIRKEGIFQEALVLDTCNRTEFYLVGDDDRRQALRHMLAHVAELKDAEPLEDLSVFYRHDGLAAARHLLRVASGLDSQVLGEDEILGQVKDAYSQAVQARTARFLLNKLLHRAIRTGKRVRTETDLGFGSASVAQAAVELARHVFSTLQGRAVMLVGAGQTAEQAARALLRRGAGRLIVANRTLRTAERLTQQMLSAADEPKRTAGCGKAAAEAGTCPALRLLAPEPPEQPPSEAGPTARAIELSAIPEAIGEVDLVVSSTSAQGYVLRYGDLAAPLREVDHSVLIVDIAVPRDVDPRLEELPDVFLHNIDNLDGLVARTMERRRREVPKAEAIVEWETEQFSDWFDSLQVVPTIKQLQRRLQQMGEQEVRRYGSQFREQDQERLERFAQGLCKKILHRPITMLRELATDNGNTDDLAAVDVIRSVFDLDETEHDE